MTKLERSFLNEAGASIRIVVVDGIDNVRIHIVGPSSQQETEITKREAFNLLGLLAECDLPEAGVLRPRTEADVLHPPESWKRAYAKLLVDFYRHEIGTLMHQAQHWADNGKPFAVHHRLHKADAYYQIVAHFERYANFVSNDDPFLKMRSDIDRGHIHPPGKYPPSAELHKYRDPASITGKVHCHDDLIAALKSQIEVSERLMVRAGFSLKDIQDCTAQARGAVAKASGAA